MGNFLRSVQSLLINKQQTVREFTLSVSDKNSLSQQQNAGRKRIDLDQSDPHKPENSINKSQSLILQKVKK